MSKNNKKHNGTNISEDREKSQKQIEIEKLQRQLADIRKERSQVKQDSKQKIKRVLDKTNPKHDQKQRTIEINKARDTKSIAHISIDVQTDCACDDRQNRTAHSTITSKPKKQNPKTEKWETQYATFDLQEKKVKPYPMRPPPTPEIVAKDNRKVEKDKDSEYPSKATLDSINVMTQMLASSRGMTSILSKYKPIRPEPKLGDWEDSIDEIDSSLNQILNDPEVLNNKMLFIQTQDLEDNMSVLTESEPPIIKALVGDKGIEVAPAIVNHPPEKPLESMAHSLDTQPSAVWVPIKTQHFTIYGFIKEFFYNRLDYAYSLMTNGPLGEFRGLPELQPTNLNTQAFLRRGYLFRGRASSYYAAMGFTAEVRLMVYPDLVKAIYTNRISVNITADSDPIFLAEAEYRAKAHHNNIEWRANSASAAMALCLIVRARVSHSNPQLKSGINGIKF
jgi:hypothetical protein